MNAAAAVAVPAAGGAERVEEADQLIGRSRPGRLGGGVELAGPHLVDPVEVGDDRSSLAGKCL